MSKIKIVKKYARSIASEEGVQEGYVTGKNGALVKPVELYEKAMVNAYKRMSHKDKGEFIKIIKEELNGHTGE